MNHRYDVTLKLNGAGPYLRFGAGQSELHAIVRRLTGLLEGHVGVDQWGGTRLTLSADAPDEAALLNELLVLMQEAGYSLINGEVTKYASLTLEGAVVAGIGGIIGGSQNSDAVALIAGAVGAVGGALVGSRLRRVEKVYDLLPNSYGGWTWIARPVESGPSGGLALA